MSAIYDLISQTGDSLLCEGFFAAWLDEGPDVVAFVKVTDGTIYVVETKGRAEFDLPRKMARLSQWCADAAQAEQGRVRYDFVFVDEDGFSKHTPKTFVS